ncbi:MAG TPA: hypothetical protein VK481_03265, partial [Gemmatimonadaceae bacterium]|nr:hypothetical protein [Gemmatimonadaceae bacterium]
DAAGTAVLEFNVDGVRIYVPSGAFTYSWGSPSSRGAPNSWFVGSRGGTSTFFDGTLDEATIYVTPVRWPFTSISDFSNFIAAKEELLTHYEAGSNPWNGDLAGERVVHILDVMEWPDSERDISTGAVTLQAANFGANSIYEEFARIMLTELGRLFIDRQGRVALDGRYDASGAVSQATFGDGVGEVPYTAMLIDYDEALLTNSILAQRDNGTEFVISDTDSQGTYYPRSYSASGLLYQDDDQTAGFARVVLSRRKDPVIRVTMTITADANPALCYPQVLGREIGNVGTFKRRPQSIGTAISQDCTIDAISHDITPDWWITTFEGTQAYINDFWTLGDSVAGVLGVTTALGF